MSNIAAEAVKLQCAGEYVTICNLKAGTEVVLLMKLGLSATSQLDAVLQTQSTDLSGGINLPVEMAKESTEGWNLNGSDVDVNGNLIKSNRGPMWRGSAAHSHCLRLNGRQGDLFLVYPWV